MASDTVWQVASWVGCPPVELRVTGTRLAMSMRAGQGQGEPRLSLTSALRLPQQEGVLFFKLIFTGVELIYNVVLVSAVQQSESLTHIHISTFF